VTPPGTQLVQRETAPPRSAPADTSTWFVAGLSEKGPAAPVLITSMARFTRIFGSRQAYSLLYDAAETFFREGGSRLYVSRVIGPAPVLAAASLYDAAGSTAGDIALAVKAASYGDWGNALNIEVVAGGVGGTFVLVVSHDTAGELERSGDLVDRAAAVAWAESSEYVDITLGASAEDPRAQGPTSLTGGTDDHASAVDAQWAAALARFGADLGPGQVSMPGRTTAQAHADTIAHAVLRKRVALLDAADTATVGTLTAAAEADRTNGRYASLWAPWAIIPGIVAGTTRTVPYSAVQAGLIARSDARFSANVPAAGDNGQARFAIDLSQPAWTDAERDTLNDAGVNVARLINGTVRTYGYRSLADPDDDPNWAQFSGARLNMAIFAKADAIAERYVFAQLDGKRQKIGEFGGAVVGELLPFYAVGALYGETPEEAFNVDVGDQVNTLETIAEGELHAVIAYRPSPFGETVIIEIVKIPTTEAVA
jgi:hypothetical protein